MKKIISTVFCILLVAIAAFAQNNSTISGNVKSSSNENISAVSVMLKGSTLGTYTDDKGNFKITGNIKFPAILVFSSVGYADKEVQVSSAGEKISVSLSSSYMLAQEVVVSASRLPERILESPVTIERVNAANIRNGASPSYYDLIANMKGVDMITSSLNFKTPSTRGFNSSGNLRLNQLVDGMDNQAPGLNFSVGSMIGPTDLDVESVELLGGASSALYGPGGMNGTLLINSKNPFKYQGLSVQVKQGIMHMSDNARTSSGYNDYSLRYARALSDKFAFKFGVQYVEAKDWVAQDSSNFDRGTNPAKGNVKTGTRSSDPNYNGINTYGDETSVDMTSPGTPLLPTVVNLMAQQTSNPALIQIMKPYTTGAFAVSRTGYQEKDIIDPTTKNLRFNGSLNYKITPGIEASLMANWGTGTTVYTGSDRYNLKDFKMAQYKAEIKHKNWFFRAYTTQEDAGKSFNATATTQLYNEAWKPSANTSSTSALLGSWYPQYAIAFTTGAATVFQQAFMAAMQAGQNQQQASATAQAAMLANTAAFHAGARKNADQGMPVVGSDQFRRLFDSVASRPINAGGGLFVDKSSLYMAEGQYNLTDVVKFAEVLVGANFKQYVLNSEGTIFADTAGRIKISEIGAYAQVSKKLFKDVLKLTASGRFDKNSNFKGRFTPRFSAVITPVKNNSIRLSYQTAYRFPSTQNQWINLVIGGGVRLLGGLPDLREFYKFNTNPVYTPESVIAGNPVKATFGEYKPESSTSYEIGYKTLINNKLLIDVYGYYTQYTNFIGRQTVLQSKDGTPAGLSNPNIFSVSVNTTEKVNTQGFGLSVEYLLPKNFSINGNFYSDEIKNVPDGFVTYYNTPKFRTNIGLSNTGCLYKNRVGFSVQYRYQDSYTSQSDFITGNTPSFNTVDAQINYKFPSIKSIIKIGGTNLTNHYYVTAIGNPSIGAIYYASFAYNVF